MASQAATRTVAGASPFEPPPPPPPPAAGAQAAATAAAAPPAWATRRRRVHRRRAARRVRPAWALGAAGAAGNTAEPPERAPESVRASTLLLLSSGGCLRSFFPSVAFRRARR